MTEREALKLALEALHGFIPYLPLNDEAQCGRYDKAITAIKEALAQPEQEPVANGKLKVTLQDTPTEIELAQYKRMLLAACADLGAINEALGLDPNDGGAEPILFALEELKGRSQEPMAWMVYTLDGTSVCVTDNPSSFTPEHRALPLYTTPPQRKPLSDEEIEDIWADCPADWDDKINVLTLARAIEAAHGIKELV